MGSPPSPWRAQYRGSVSPRNGSHASGFRKHHGWGTTVLGYKHEPGLCADEDVTDGAEGGECAAGGVSVPHPPTPNPGRSGPGRREDCPPPTVCGEACAWSATPFGQSTPHFEAQRFTEITFKGWIRVSVFRHFQAGKEPRPGPRGDGAGLDFHYSEQLQPSLHHVGGLRRLGTYVLCFCEPAL
jgi:hypothetical protein